MNEGYTKQFSSPEEEINFLRQQIAEREREVLARTPEIDKADSETLGREQIKEYVSFTPKVILHPDYELQGQALAESVELVDTAHDPVEEVMQIALEKGIRNALTVLDKTTNAYVIDEVHRRLIEHIQSGVEMADLKEGVPPWHVLHMTLYEVTLPAQKSIDGNDLALGDLVGKMEQLYSGLRTIGSAKEGNHFVIEIAVADYSDDIIFYVAVPNEFKSLFEKQTLSLFPNAVLKEQVHDYNIYVDKGHTLVANLELKKNPIYSIKTQDEFSTDPLAVILNAFSKIEREGGGAAIQFVIRHPKKTYQKTYEEVIKLVEKGTKPGEAISRSTVGGEILASVSDFFFSSKKKEGEIEPVKEVDSQAIEIFRKKIAKPIVEVNIRVVVSATEKHRAEQILTELESTFNQFDTTAGNQIKFKTLSGSNLRMGEKAFSFRQFSTQNTIPLSLAELATLMHFPGDGTLASPQVKQSHSNTAPAPTEMPNEGTLLGINRHRNVERKIFISELDRMRHFYIIGQTGTGKTTLMKNMIIQDIQQGSGVCLIDPHGTDIEDVLGAVPPEREQDIIYFDPSRMDRVIGLNMLEYDYSKPEMKTFVVNELFSIFQKLYGANPESMGPMFEQYFRNATMLVMEDPESGNTLMDIGRVMVDAPFRKKKLEKATNPVVIQFWTEIATKAGGEASLENIVPYIVSKFDVFTANDYMRPIIGQQRSAFDFRKVMDERKILLVNLAKGRLGEINSSLIGMIFVGKILMAALSRVDDPTKSFPPFYLHMDEFQNISTNSISAILSEARKYKLGLTIAHQFIAQLQPDIKDAVFGNVGSMAAFRVGPEDAQFLEQQFKPTFTASDLMNVPNANAFMRVLANGTPTPPFSMGTMAPAETDLVRVQRLIEDSYKRYGYDRAEIEEEIRVRYQKPAPPVPPAPSMR
ncbi:type IV secretion system DNA-binding domain-containing protein [Candidatus Nomurabacteria bacterium]|nr:type IV secretion system DNA-binding domain-containing protein [Candidatus Kaiserbacteria bacterium]MCB9814081.1 type IV secretion system DNA-binding domain-containing protein [Candidatus Nomurabacteria bacterium]